MHTKQNLGVELANETGVDASGNGSSKGLAILGGGGVVFQLRVTAAAALSTDKLDVTVQSTIDGSNWFDVAAFTQVAGDATPPVSLGQKVQTAKNESSVLDLTATISAGSKIDFCGNLFRAKWTITDVSAPSFDFTVHAAAMP